VDVHEAEIARARFLWLAPDGFEEVERGDRLELAAYGDEHVEALIRATFPTASTDAVEAGWEDRWRAFHRPVLAGGLWIGPPWDEPAAPDSVVIDPGRAFGTGAHATTRACVELLARSPRASVVDAGCGSGVLSIAAVKLGFDPVFAMDVDPEAVEAARGNAQRNGVELDVRQSDALTDALPTADLLVANIELQVVRRLLARWTGPAAITSGYLVHERPDADGWAHEERIELDGWAADRLSRVE
jgi:ribosomal protein L11 methyltransferase